MWYAFKLLPILACGFSAPVWAGIDGSLRTGQWVAGAVGTLDAATGLAGEGAGAQSLHGTVLGEATWTQPRSETAPPAVQLSAYASVLYVEGRGPSERILGDFLTASNSEAFQSFRLYSWWLEGERDGWSLRAGALLADEEFAGTSPGGALINSAFGWPVFISANTLNTGPAYYAAALGARLAWANAQGWSARAGVYDGDSFDSAAGNDRPNRHGTHFRLNEEQGAFFISEIGYAPVESARRFSAGVWMHTADFSDPATGALRTGNQGAYVVAERTLRGRSGEPGAVEAHVRYGLAPSDRNLVSWAADVAVAATGWLTARPDDTLALGVAHARLADGPGGLDYERVVELSYTAAVTQYVSVQPDLQWIEHVGGDSTRGDAWLFLLRLQAVY